jgi:hypothetical protein
MRVADERAWRGQLAELDADDGSRRFRDFLLAWADAAESRLAVAGGEPRPALLAAFDDVEAGMGFLSVEWLSQMLLVLVQHWADGERLWESMSVWERRMVEQATAVKLVELQRSAAGEPDSTAIEV